MARIAELRVADEPAVWQDLGFSVEGRVCTVGGVAHALGAEGRGITSWLLAGMNGDAAASGEAAIDGLPTQLAPSDAGTIAGAGPGAPTHPNGVVAIDHIVVSTPDVDRTTAAFEEAGLELRRRRHAETHGRVMRQSFFVLDGVILEVIGPPEVAGDGPARFLGLAFTSSDLDATAAHLGPRLHAAKQAVQPGRLIATLDRGAATTVAMAFMSPTPARKGADV